MHKLLLSLILMLVFIDCTPRVQSDTEVSMRHPLVGAERLDAYLPLLEAKKVGMVVNQTSVIGETHLVDSLMSLGVEVVKVFAPEHGFRGDHSDGATIKDGIDQESGLPIVSLYGKNKKPSQQMLEGLDIIVFDIQDVGVRFYTFISTMHYVMEACAEKGIPLLVLDRPNPNGFYVDGPVLKKEYSSFIGMHPIPLVHGLTIAELALMINGEYWLKGGLQCELYTIACKEYDHQTLYELPISPSPNLPNMNAVYLYPSLGLFEGTKVSVGRGTDQPFQIIGMPDFKGTIRFTPRSIPGVSDHPKYENRECGGLEIPDYENGQLFEDPKLNVDYLLLMYQSWTGAPTDFFRDFFYKLSGTDLLRIQIEQGLSAEQIRDSWKPDLADFLKMRKKYLLYP